MLKTSLCELLGIEVPIILAPMGSATSAEFAAAVSNLGGLGSIGSLNRTTAAIKRDIDLVREVTNRHYAVNHIPPTLDREAFQYTLDARPAVISFALGDPGDLVRQAQAVGALVMLQITTVAQAIEGAERGVDVIIAQGGEAGGYGGAALTTREVSPGQQHLARIYFARSRSSLNLRHSAPEWTTPCAARCRSYAF